MSRNPRNNRSIFVVDDELQVRNAIRETIEEPGTTVVCFHSPVECLEHLRRERCDLLITDLKMPQMDGIDLLKQARVIAPWLPVLVVTGYGNIPTAFEAGNAGAVDFLEKPLVRKTFLRRVKTLLAKSHAFNRLVGTSLTAAELRVLKLVVDGKSNMEIAGLLHRSIRTIEVHRKRVRRKLGADNLMDLVKRAAAMGLIDLPARPKPQGP